MALLATAGLLQAQGPASRQYVCTGLFFAAIEEGGRIFTPARLLPFEHPEALGHQFPTVQQLHSGEDRLLLILGRHVELLLGPTLQRYPTEPDTLWPYAPFLPPPVAAFDSVTPVARPGSESPLPGLRTVAYFDRLPVAFIVDTRGLSLSARHMNRPTAMGLDISRAELLEALRSAAEAVPTRGPAILVFQRTPPH